MMRLLLCLAAAGCSIGSELMLMKRTWQLSIAQQPIAQRLAWSEDGVQLGMKDFERHLPVVAQIDRAEHRRYPALPRSRSSGYRDEALTPTLGQRRVPQRKAWGELPRRRGGSERHKSGISLNLTRTLTLVRDKGNRYLAASR